ncbi:MAG: POTRA domain-containing protein [Terriglobales bacterium]
MRAICFAVALACSLLFSASRTLSESAPKAPSYMLQAVSITGSKRFSEPDLMKATSLRIGSSVTAEELRQAADRLNQSGAFTQVGYGFDGKVATYVVTDSDQFVPASFENFVWYSDGELTHRIHDSVPLFAGSVPLAGNLKDQVVGVLDLLLKEKGARGQTVAASFPDSGPPTSMLFRVEGSKITIARIDFPGAGSDRLALLQPAMKDVIGSVYLRSAAPEAIRKRAAATYGRLGYLKARFGVPKVSFLKEDADGPDIALEVPVEEGPQYTFAGADWSGNRAISNADLAKLIDLKVGAPADTRQLSVAIAGAQGFYGTKGFMYAQVKATATLDNEKHTSVIHLTVDEGVQYHMRKLELLNLPPDQIEVVRRVWEIKAGDVYDSNYPKTFLKNHPRELAFLDGWAATYTQTIDDDQHVVDLSMKFVKMQGGPQ